MGLASVADYVQGTVQFYSKWKNWRELFLIPYRKERKLKDESRFIIERTTTLDKLKKTETAGPSPELAMSQSNTRPDKQTLSKYPRMSKGGEKFVEENENKLSVLTEKEDKEVRDEKYLFNEVYFARSKTPRTNRPAHVKLRVGEVVRHKRQGYYGVIVGWDEHALVRGEHALVRDAGQLVF